MSKRKTMGYEVIVNWTAKRAGARITIYGRTPYGDFRRVTNVEQIAVESGVVLATDRDGTKYRLAL